MVKEIRCKNGEIALCDDEDYPLLSRFIWYMGSEVKNGGGYPCCFIYGKNNTRKQIFMHQLVMAGATNQDHIDRNKLNTQKENLRNSTHQENGWNQGKQKTFRGRPCLSRFKGVTRVESKTLGRRWFASIKVEAGRNGRVLRIGYFQTEEDAARAYDAKCKELRGQFAWLNEVEPLFPENYVNQDARTRESDHKGDSEV